ncbi:uncharacterized protein LOC5574440 isoform X2 [Aedes aegypti]|uniref:Uncharacterized protein n=1 Tax=Aedes aegypti TaxID=7159 RepID=A0A6I8TM57_AEDAE|nr:uncharacterized protein LOC5574440 isoform X2 [Aedes aegypti]
MSSSESEDENIKRFLEAADTTLINDAMFQGTSAEKQNEPVKDNVIKTASECPKSNRYLVEEENVFQSDINVTESMKKFVGKKLSAIIDQNIAFIEVKDKKVSKSKTEPADSSGVKLLSDCDLFLKTSDAIENATLLPESKTKKPIKRRAVESDCLGEKEKLALAAIEPSSISALTKCRTNRPKAVVYEYKTAGSSNLLQEPKNEFTEAKRKNKWDSSKIAQFGKKVKGR